MKLLEKQEKDEKECQARIEAQKKQAKELSLNLACEFLPGLEKDPQHTSIEAASVVSNINKEASRLYAELLLCVCWDTEPI